MAISKRKSFNSTSPPPGPARSPAPGWTPGPGRANGAHSVGTTSWQFQRSGCHIGIVRSHLRLQGHSVVTLSQRSAWLALAMPRVSEALRLKGEEIGERTDIGDVTKMKQMNKLLTENNLLWVESLHAKFVLVHKQNRSGLLINAFDAHRNLASVASMGADRDQLKYSYAFATHGAAQEQHYSANRSLVAGSNGMLAPVTGAERVFSVGSGHFAASVRAFNHGCKTPEPSLSTETGFIDTARLRKDEEFAHLADVGWDWNIISGDAEEAWPWLPDLYQRALNAFNNVPSKATELEVACSISEFALVAEQSGNEAMKIFRRRGDGKGEAHPHPQSHPHPRRQRG